MDDEPFDDAGEGRRVDYLGREAFQRAVQIAATEATQRVAKIHRARLVRQAAGVTFCTSLLVSLVVAIGLYQAATNAAHTNSVRNCRLLQDISGPLASFVASDARLREREAVLGHDRAIVAGFGNLFGKSHYADLVRRSALIDQQATDYWKTSISPKLASVARTDCH